MLNSKHLGANTLKKLMEKGEDLEAGTKAAKGQLQGFIGMGVKKGSCLSFFF